MKKAYNKSIIIAAVFCLLMVFSGCTGHFEEYNKNEHNPYQKDMTNVEKIVSLFPTMISSIHQYQQNNCQHTEQMIGQYGGHLVTSVNWQGSNFANFNPQQDYIARPWNDCFSMFYVNYLEVKKLTDSEGYLYHMANILRVASQHRVADMYGPIPYSQVGTSMTAEYDDVKDVYINMINDLTASIEALTVIVETASSTSVPLDLYDTIYGAASGSELAKWVKYANSLKLRLAVRIAAKNDPADFATNAIEEVMTHSIGPILSNTDNAISKVPLSVSSGYWYATGWGDVRLNATLTTYMNAFKDPRIPMFMRPGTQTNPDYTANIGVRMGAATGTTNKWFKFEIEPSVAPETYTIMKTAADDNVLLFSAAETHFLLAEANVRGWYTAGQSAQYYYETGIELSMQQYGVKSAEIDGYMTETMTAAEGVYSDPREAASSDDGKDKVTGFDIFAAFSDLDASSVISVAWDAQDTDEKKIEAIITQKWIANYTLGIEAWCDWRRTGYPRLFPAVNDNSGGKVNNPATNINIDDVRMARRIPYPSIEANSNPNYEDVLTMLGGDDSMTTELWWAKGKQ